MSEKFYEIILGVAVILNILYTIYSYNDINKWRIQTTSQIEAVDAWQRQVDTTVKEVTQQQKSVNENIEKSVETGTERDKELANWLQRIEQRVKAVEDRVNNANTNVEKVTGYLKNEQKITDQSQDSIVKSMMLLETRLYAVEEEVYKLEPLEK